MLEINITPKRKCTESSLEKLFTAMGLTITMQGVLKSIAANRHWHLKNGKQKGVLEVTLMHETGEVLLSVHDNRRGGWEKEMIDVISAKLQQ